MDIKRKIRFIFCSFVPVGLEDYVEYMRRNFPDFIYFRWRFHHVDPKKICSAIQIFDEDILLKEQKLLSIPKINNKLFYFLALPITYLIYFLQAVKNLIFAARGNKIIVFMGVNYFCALCGIMLKFLRIADFVIYRVMDFFPMPENGPYRILHRIFYVMDRICIRYSDAIWFTTIGHIEGREEYGYFDRRKYSFEIIPLGIKQCNFSLSNPKEHSIVYCGNVSRYHLLDMLFSAVKNLRIKYPDIQLNVIGSGRDELYFKDIAEKTGLNGNIHFHGFIKDDRIIAENAIGIALYRDEENFMKYTEPAKVKTYLGYGVPVIVSDIPRIAGEIARNRVGFSIKNSVDELCNTIEYFFNNKELREEYRKNIANYVKRFDVNELLDKTFANTFERFGV